MALGREMHHRIGPMRGEHLPHGGGVGDVGADMDVAVMAARVAERILRGGVGHLVDVDDHMVACRPSGGGSPPSR